MNWDRDAVLVGAVAAWVSFWPEIRVSGITCSLKHQRRPSQAMSSLDGRFLLNLSSAGRAFVIHARRSLPWIFARRWVAMR